MATLALLIAGVGVYSGIAYAFSERSREIGIRLAMGARNGQVVRMVMRRAVAMVGAGAVIGLTLAVSLSHLIMWLAYGISPRDPETLVGSPVLLIVLGIAAALVPALRASRVDPVTVLGSE